MKIFVIAKLNKNKDGVEKYKSLYPSESELSGLHNGYIVWTKMPPKENKANIDIIAQLARYFNITKSSVILKSGATSKKKTFIIEK